MSKYCPSCGSELNYKHKCWFLKKDMSKIINKGIEIGTCMALGGIILLAVLMSLK